MASGQRIDDVSPIAVGEKIMWHSVALQFSFCAISELNTT